jgi:hypothetical protein
MAMKSRLKFAVLPLLFLALVACESSTDLDEVTATGRWDSVGALQGVTLFLNPESGGNFTGTWSTHSATVSASIINGTNTNGTIRFTLTSFQGGNRTFEGRFTNEYRMEGTLDGVALNGAAVFRRSSF